MRFFYLLFALPLFTSCTKDEVQQPLSMNIIDLKGVEIKSSTFYYSIDVNNDNIKDILFSTVQTEDDVTKEKKLSFYVSALDSSSLLINEDKETFIYFSGDGIPLNDFNVFKWVLGAQSNLFYKVTPDGSPSYWEGYWKNLSNNYLGIQLINNGKRYVGWIELSTDTDNEKLTLFRAALCNDAEKPVIAGK